MASSSPRSTASGVRSSCEMSAIKSRRICWFFSRMLASWLKSCASLPSSSWLRVSTRVVKSPAASLCVPSTSRFTGASRPRASGKVASAASSVERATISQLVRRCWRSKLMSVLRVRRSTGEAITQPTVVLFTLIARRVPSGGIGARGPTRGRISWSITQNWVRQPCGGMPGPGRSSPVSCSSERRIWKIKRSLLRRKRQLPCWAYCSLSASLKPCKRCSLPCLM